MTHAVSNENINSNVDVVVVGGGYVGCCVLYYLSCISGLSSILLEKDDLTSGTTWHSAGNITLSEPSEQLSVLNKFSWDLTRLFEKENGEDLAFHKTGSLFLAKDAATLNIYENRCNNYNDKLGIRCRVVDVKEIEKLHPLVNLDGVLGAAYIEDEGHIDPTIATNAFARAARSRGAQIARGRAVTQIEPTPDGTWFVRCDDQKIACKYLVVSTGIWTAAILKQIGLSIPIVATERQYVVTGRIPELDSMTVRLPLLRDFSVPFYARQEQKSFLVGIHEPHTPYCFEDGIPKDFTRALLPGDLERGMGSLTKAIERLPVLEHAGIKTLICGPTSRTPDLQALLGPVPEFRNLFIAAGFTAGITQGPAVGKLIADRIAGNCAAVDTTPLDVARFGEYATRSYVKASLSRAHVFGTVDPTQNREQGLLARTSPLYTSLRDLGAHFMSRDGWQVPIWFANGAATKDEAVEAEKRAIQGSAALIDLPGLSIIEVSGPDASRVIDAPSSVTRGEFRRHDRLSDELQAEVFVLGVKDDRALLYSRCSERRLLRSLVWHPTLPKHLRYRNLTSTEASLMLAGPETREVINEITQTDLGKTMKPWSFIETQIGFAPARLMRGDAKKMEWVITTPIPYHFGVYEQLMALKNCKITNAGSYAHTNSFCIFS